jgi:uncharacterized protein YlaI
MSSMFYYDSNVNISEDLYEGTKAIKSIKNKSFKVYLCPECGRIFDSHGRISAHNYYLFDFPKFGIEKNLCKECKK